MRMVVHRCTTAGRCAEKSEYCFVCGTCTHQLSLIYALPRSHLANYAAASDEYGYFLDPMCLHNLNVRLFYVTFII